MEMERCYPCFCRLTINNLTYLDDSSLGPFIMIIHRKAATHIVEDFGTTSAWIQE
ncbi:hypothetical protein Syun_002287 [Stephania yunnanensis]|uniref:Uncharacterized protein n=1 Tax=Stephania yunnanensis TaxID=152371 RepID=A0AAP0LHA0_9MAGN